MERRVEIEHGLLPVSVVVQRRRREAKRSVQHIDIKKM